MIKVAVTGGIGAGKSFICEIFNKLGIPVFNADHIARQLFDSNQEVRKKVIGLFGEDVYQPNGAINRKKLADLVFDDKIALSKLNDIIHPEVRKEFHEWVKKQKAPYVIQESAIVFESGIEGNFDKIITVSAPEELRIKRVMQRDGMTREKVLERMKNQKNEKEKIMKSDFIIENDEIKMILPQVINIHNKLK
ncbi:MAG: dephospho-CoA kinase [Prolixibacteraceae bacterium]|nr:dephospho-CoA kinase [Prolixibacteraceae bacterium]